MGHTLARLLCSMYVSVIVEHIAAMLATKLEVKLVMHILQFMVSVIVMSLHKVSLSFFHLHTLLPLSLSLKYKKVNFWSVSF